MTELDGTVSGYPLDLRDGRRRASDAAGPVGDFEYMAARVVARYTGARVVLQDDGSSSYMPDIRIERAEAPIAFVEVVVDIEQKYAATWMRANHPSSTRNSSQLRRVWTLMVSAACRVDDLQQHDERLLAELEASGHGERASVIVLARVHSSSARELQRLGVVEVFARSPGSGETPHIRLMSEGVEGPINTNWSAVRGWMNRLLASTKTEDVRRKLAATGAEERHVFVGISYTTPGEVFYALERGKGLPLEPNLPPEVAHLWFMRASSPGGRCLHWSPVHGWRDVQEHWRTA